MRIVLKTARKEIAHKIHDFRIETAVMPMLNRCVILINNDDAFFAIMFVQQQRQKLQSHLAIHLIGLPSGKATILLFFVSAQHRACFKFIMPYKFQRNQLLDLLKGFFPVQAFYILKGQKDNRVLPLMPGI